MSAFPTSHGTALPIRAGASIAVIKDGAVLLVKRAAPPWRGLWSLPGGKVGLGEAPRDTALRELKEETGIEADRVKLLDTIDISAEDDGGGTLRYRLTVFYGRYAGGTLRAGSDAAAAEWVALDALAALPMTQGTAPLIRLAARRLGTA